ncbi:hypothetical protein SB00048_00605 [Klebsiella variicola]|nr:hypothetical protein SB00048_00605 [Klebsiella variicola]
MIADKTKAALQSCQCHYQIPKQSQHTRVGAGGQSLNRVQICILVDFSLFLWQSVKWRFVPKSLIIPPVLTLRTGVGCQIMSRLNIEPADFIQLLRQSPKVSFAYNSLTPLFFLTLGKKGGKSNPTLCFLFLQTDYRVSHIRALTIQYVEYAVATKKTTAIASRHLPRSVSGINHSSGSALAFLRWSSLSFLRNDSSGNCIDLAFGSASTGCEFFCSFVMCQPLGSMPRCCSSLRMMRLIQAASDSSPSCCCACSISSRSSGSNLNWNGGLPRLSFLCVDTLITPDVMCLCVMTHYIQERQIATPRSAGTLPRRLTKPLYEVTVMAGSQHTQTHPEFTWRFLSTSERNPTAKPLVIYVNASSEQEARDTMPGVTLIFAARLPFHAFQVMEVAV